MQWLIKPDGRRMDVHHRASSRLPRNDEEEKMAIAKIIITAHILTNTLFSEGGYDLDKSAENLADLEGEIITGLLSEEYPDAEIFVDIGIHKEAGVSSTIEVLAYTEDDESLQAESEAIQGRLVEFIREGTADYSWAVKA